MNDLPTPLSRIELYLAAAAGMTGVTMPDEPMSRLEQFLAFIAGDTSVELPTPASLCEQWLAYVAGIAPAEPLKLEGAFHIGAQKVDVRFFAAAAGMPGVLAPEPQNRTEEYWAKLAEILPVHGTLKYETGTSITLTDVAWWRMRLERINGDTTQQTYTGKNLFNYLAVSYPFDTQGLNISIDADGYITFSGVLGKNYQSLIGPFDITSLLNDGETYTATQFSHDGLVMLDVYAYAQGTTTQTTIARTRTHNSESFVVDKTTYSNYFIRILSWTTASWGDEPLTLTSRFQLEKGTATDFEPYVGGVPAPNPNYPQAINTVTGEQTVTVRGKNLFDLEQAATVFENPDGVVFTGGASYSDGVVTMTWTTGAHGRRYMAGFEPTLVEGETYTLSAYVYITGTHVNSNVSIGSISSWSSVAAGGKDAWYRVSKTFTATSTDVADSRMLIQPTNTGNTMKYKDVQLEQGSTATDFQPYQKTEYKINLGKNLFDKDNPNLLVAYIDGSHTTITANGENRIIWIPCKANQTYTIQKYATNIAKEVAYTTVEPAIGVTVSGMVSWAANTSSITYTTGADAEYLVVRVYQSDKDSDYTVDQMLASVKIWEGGEDSAPIELCKISTYQDYIYRNNNDWYLHNGTRGVVLDGGENGWYKSSYVYRLNGAASDVASSTAIGIALCDKFIYWPNTGSISTSLPNCRFGWAQDRSNIDFRYDAIADADAWRAWLAANPIKLYYALATATDTKITNPTLISQLNALDRAVLPQPIAYITASGDLPGELKISYYGEEE